MTPNSINYTFSPILKKLLWSPHLKAVRNGLTLTLPLVMAGSVATLIQNFPVRSYQAFMAAHFGERWNLFCGQIVEGTFSILALIMLLTISFSLAEFNNTKSGKNEMHPAVVALVSLACLIAIGQTYPFASGEGIPGGSGMPVMWLGIHGLFVAIIVAFLSTKLFFRLRKIPALNISFYSEEADASIAYAFSAMLPGMLTILAFALFKAGINAIGIESIHQAVHEILSLSFAKMGNTFPTALIYTFIRHFFWFFGIHGSNLLEPVTTALYVPAMEANIAAHAAGSQPPYIFTQTFFDAFISMGGSGSTISLLLAVFIFARRGSMYKISQISLLPAVFNINEMVVFGLPIVLSPVFFLPFTLVPMVQCAIAYAATEWGLLPHTIQNIDWTSPAFIGGYAATKSWAGSVMQLVNMGIGIAIYAPFVRLADIVKKETFDQAFRELMPGYVKPAEYTITAEAKALSSSLANDLSEAIARKELSLEYQPQVDSKTGKVFGVEALMRWDHTHLGRIPPGMFINLAEQTRIIRPMGTWALEEACRQWDEWRRMGVDDVVMSVNLSVHQLNNESIVGEIADRIKRYNIPKGMLEVEVTESAALGGDGKFELLTKIHDLGVALAIDDFGMGHGSLVYLKQFPVNTIKIDRVLAKDVTTNRFSSEIINSISELCRSLKIETIVEYVESVEQLRVLQGLGCTRIQGWLYSPSLPARECLEFIRKGTKVY